MVRHILPLFLAVTLLGQQSAAQRKSIADIAKAANGAVVSIVVSNKKGRPIAQGSGFLISKDGQVVTNYHVIKDGASAIIKLPDGAFFAVDGVLTSDKDKDIAVVKAHGNNFKVLTLGDSDRIQVGDDVVAIGTPLSLESTVSNGIVSAIRRDDKDTFLQITAPISPGSSGGPLFNMAGEVIGITTAHLRSGENLNFAIPINNVKTLFSADVKAPHSFPNGVEAAQPSASAAPHDRGPKTGGSAGGQEQFALTCPDPEAKQACASFIEDKSIATSVKVGENIVCFRPDADEYFTLGVRMPMMLSKDKITKGAVFAWVMNHGVEDGTKVPSFGLESVQFDNDAHRAGASIEAKGNISISDVQILLNQVYENRNHATISYALNINLASLRFHERWSEGDHTFAESYGRCLLNREHWEKTLFERLCNKSGTNFTKCDDTPDTRNQTPDAGSQVDLSQAIQVEPEQEAAQSEEPSATQATTRSSGSKLIVLDSVSVERGFVSAFALEPQCKGLTVRVLSDPLPDDGNSWLLVSTVPQFAWNLYPLDSTGQHIHRQDRDAPTAVRHVCEIVNGVSKPEQTGVKLSPEATACEAYLTSKYTKGLPKGYVLDTIAHACEGPIDDDWHNWVYDYTTDTVLDPNKATPVGKQHDNK